MKKCTISRSGQLFSGDIAIATMVFLGSLAAMFFLWNSVTEDINHSEDLRYLEKVASEVSEQLVRTPGVPADWNYYTVTSFGLAEDDRVINQSKAIMFINMMNSTSYEQNIGILGVAPYNFHLNVTDLDNNAITIGGEQFEAGMPLEDEDESIAVVRTSVFNQTIVRINMVFWR